MSAQTHLPEMVWAEEWLAARKDVLVKEKESEPGPRAGQRRAAAAAADGAHRTSRWTGL
jgi:predicted dithiol-disulfide oxidoreductase (DUF899 family)